jgi:ATP/maltotriose-dependent transcriptional regulator MalT
MNDEKLMQREDVQTMVKDWVHYRYKDFRELDQIAIEAAEDQLSNREWKSY